MANIHQFHFVLNEKLLKRIKGLFFFQAEGGFSGVVRRILSALRPILRDEHNWNKQRHSKYMLVHPDKDEPRKHVCAYIDEDSYRFLKLMHADLNAYSIALIVRGFLRFFLCLVEVYEDRVFEYLAGFSTHDPYEGKHRLPKRKAIQQLKLIMALLPGRDRLLTLYDKNYTPFKIFRL